MPEDLNPGHRGSSAGRGPVTGRRAARAEYLCEMGGYAYGGPDSVEEWRIMTPCLPALPRTAQRPWSPEPRAPADNRAFAHALTQGANADGDRGPPPPTGASPAAMKYGVWGGKSVTAPR